QGDKKVSRITISEELLYYVVDEKDEDRPQSAATKDQAVVQVHRWIGEARTKPGQAGSEVQVGDWTVLKRRVVHRGEYLGRVEEVEVPTWNPAQDRFIIAVHPTEQKNMPKGKGVTIKRYKGIPIDFATDPYGDRALVVDFEGGEHTLNIGNKQTKESGPVEMLILTADGRLIVRNSREDTENKERQERVTAWKTWVDQVRNQSDEKSGDKNDLFQRNPGGKGGAGANPGNTGQ